MDLKLQLDCCDCYGVLLLCLQLFYGLAVAQLICRDGSKARWQLQSIYMYYSIYTVISSPENKCSHLKVYRPTQRACPSLKQYNSNVQYSTSSLIQTALHKPIWSPVQITEFVRISENIKNYSHHCNYDSFASSHHPGITNQQHRRPKETQSDDQPCVRDQFPCISAGTRPCN